MDTKSEVYHISKKNLIKCQSTFYANLDIIRVISKENKKYSKNPELFPKEFYVKVDCTKTSDTSILCRSC